MIESFIGLGSNLNDPTHQISRAIQRVSDIEKLTLMQQSSLYKSAPMGPQDQDPPAVKNGRGIDGRKQAQAFALRLRALAPFCLG